MLRVTPLLCVRTTIGLGTFISLEAGLNASAGNSEEILDSACAVFERFHRAMNPADEASDVVAIRRADAAGVVSVGPETFRVLELASRIWEGSAGAFDPCTPARAGRFADLELVAPGTVRVRAPVALDLGGIAKGVAVDAAIETMIAAGAVSGLVNAGGDLRVFGAPREITLLADVRESRVLIENEALAVSGPRSDRSPSGHLGFYSPRTGLDVVARAVAVRAPSAGVADALTKCVLVCVPQERDTLLGKFGASLVDSPGSKSDSG
jgi:thiamine biosynthesis lipoprotein